ncbi:PilZ domain-containing protein [Aquabacterium sp.]|uniref:PilZ domain-containing protein n=1 Tax=Aquabacterium sp. TaxID=1872578 RepID=UPI0035B2246F
MEQDARLVPRINVAWRARVLIEGDGFLEGRVLNVSVQGACLRLDHAFPIGTRLTIALAVPNPDDRTKTQGVVLQAKVAFLVASECVFKVGVTFLESGGPNLQLIERWVQNRF